ncbi:hypothetical protein BS78_02G081800 [Paspalum vaginatum]|nr:hypothetical protein BS78_02G081800 [Paspalum vaginatum]
MTTTISTSHRRPAGRPASASPYVSIILSQCPLPFKLHHHEEQEHYGSATVLPPHPAVAAAASAALHRHRRRGRAQHGGALGAVQRRVLRRRGPLRGEPGVRAVGAGGRHAGPAPGRRRRPGLLRHLPVPGRLRVRARRVPRGARRRRARQLPRALRAVRLPRLASWYCGI